MASSPITSWQINGETVEKVADFILGGSKITADGDCSHEIKRHLLLGRKVMTNLDSIFESRDITLSTKVHLVKAMVFPVVMCQELPREIPPMTRSCGRELLSKTSELKGLPRLSWASTPKSESVCFTVSWLSPTPLTFTGVYCWPHFSGENQLRAIANKSTGHERNISNQTHSVRIIACSASIFRPLQLRIWLFTSSQQWEAWKA